MALWLHVRLFGLLCPFLRKADCIRTTFPEFPLEELLYPHLELGTMSNDTNGVVCQWIMLLGAIRPLK